jgi:hypothetical protein
MVDVIAASPGWRACRIEKGTTAGGEYVRRVACVEVVAWRISNDETAPRAETVVGPGVHPHPTRDDCSFAMKAEGEEGMCGMAAIAVLMA